MKTLSDASGQQLYIFQPSVFIRYFEIHLGEEVIGTFNYPRWYSTLLEINLFNNKWIIYKPSFWRSTIEIKEHNKQLPFARYIKTKFKPEGTIELPRGQRLKIVIKPFKGLNELLDIKGKRLVSLKQKISFKEKTEINIEETSELIDKYPWVIVLLWLISLLHRRGYKK